MKLDQKLDGTAALTVGSKLLQTPPNNIVASGYDAVLSMAKSIKGVLQELGMHVVAEDRFTARVLDIPYHADKPFTKAA
jgi:hypothetical protein